MYSIDYRKAKRSKGAWCIHSALCREYDFSHQTLQKSRWQALSSYKVFSHCLPHLSFGYAIPTTKKSTGVTSQPHPDQSRNHTLTIRYRNKSFFNSAKRRVPIDQVPKSAKRERADSSVHLNSKKGKVGKEEEELNIVDGVIVID
jgi:hypothetical protein